MEKEIVVLDADKNQSRDLYTMLEEHKYKVVQIGSLPDLENHFSNNICQAIIMDIDSVTVTNRAIRQMAVKNPGTYFLCLSEDRFHPELKEALRNHIYACIKKPVDPEELHFWIKSIYK